MRVASAIVSTLNVCALWAAAPRLASACGACRGAGGMGGALTAGDERWSVAWLGASQVQTGSWDASGREHVQPSQVTAYDGSAQLALAVRPVRALELAAWGGAGASVFAGTGLDTGGSGWSDVTVRARWDLFAEDPSDPARFASGVWIAVRMPTGAIPVGHSAGPEGLIGQSGLGTWEVSYGLDLRRTLAHVWQPFAAAELGLRLPDDAPGFARQLGPRVTVRAGLNWFANDLVALTLLGEWTGEGDVTLGERPIANSALARTSIAFAVSFHGPGALRMAFSLGGDLPVDGLGRNSDTAVRLGVAIGYAHSEPAWRQCPTRGAVLATRATDGPGG